MKIAPLPWSQGYEYRIDPNKPYHLRMFAYNLGNESANGIIRVEDKPSGWILDRERWSLSVDPMQRALFEAKLAVPAGQADTLRLTGDFGSGGKAALATCSPEGLEIKGNVTVHGSGPSWAHPVVTGGRLYLRYADNLYCFDVKAKNL